MHLLAWVLVLWGAAFLVFKQIERRRGTPFQQWLLHHHIRVSFGFVGWYTTSFNTFLYTFGKRHASWLLPWFSAGVGFGVVGLLGSVLLLVVNLSRLLFAPATTPQLLTPVIPGVNLPLSQMGYLWLSLLICVAFHEFGHAIAAGSQGIKISRCGAFLLLIFPGAYVHISQDMSPSHTPWQQLRVYCGGAWHNLMLSLMGILVLVGLPVLFFPLFSQGEGVVVVQVEEGTPLTSRILPGDVLVSVGTCAVVDQESWESCFLNLVTSQGREAPGYCGAPPSNMELYSDLSCCDQIDYDGPLQCFHYNTTIVMQPLCARASLVVGELRCTCNSDCDEAEPSCFVPKLPEGHQIVPLFLRNGTRLLFSGHPLGLASSFLISDFLPRILARSSMILWIPLMAGRLLRYIVSFSAALGLLNMAPVFLLDGEHSLRLLLSLALGRSCSNVESLTRCILVVGSALLLVNLVVGGLALWGYNAGW